MKRTLLFIFVLMIAISSLMADIIITGTVRNLSGDPVPDLEIYLLDEDEDPYATAVTAADGSYRIVDDWGMDCYIIVATEIWRPTEIDPTEYGIDAIDGEFYTGYDFTLLTGEESAFIEGSTYHWDGFDYSIMIYAEGESETYTAFPSHGSYSMRVPPGEYHVYPMYDCTPISYDIALAAGETRSDIDFTLVETTDSGYVDVYVVTDDSTPIADAVVNIYSDYINDTLTTDDSGFARFTVMGVRNYTLTCSYDDYSVEPEMYEFTHPGETTLTYTFTVGMGSPDYIVYIYAAQDGTPSEGLTFEIAPFGTDDWTSSVTCADGTASFILTEPGDYSIRPADNPDFNVFPELFTFTLDSFYADTTVFTVFPEDVKEIMPSDMEMTVFPNPFNSSISIQSNDAQAIEIFDIYGNSIFKTSESSVLWSPSENITTGVYIIKTIFEDGSSKSERVIYAK